MRITHIITAIIISLMLFSCSSDSTNPSKTKDYLPFDIGNYWIYNIYELDGNSNPIKHLGVDSIIVAGTKTIFDKTGYELHVFRNDVIYDTLYYHIDVDAKSLSQYQYSAKDSIPYFNQWIEIINVSDDTWTAAQASSQNYKIIYSDTTVAVEVILVYNGKYEGEKNISVDNKQYETIHISNKLDTKIEFEYIDVSDTTNINITHATNMDFYLSDGIGIVMQTFRPHKKIINNVPTYYNGWQRQLIRSAIFAEISE